MKTKRIENHTKKSIEHLRAAYYLFCQKEGDAKDVEQYEKTGQLLVDSEGLLIDALRALEDLE